MKQVSLFIIVMLMSLAIDAQVGMTGNVPDPSAALDINATNKGLLIPRVALQNLTDQTSIYGNNPATGLLVYNTNAALLPNSAGRGHYYWDGSAWKKIVNSTDADNASWIPTGNSNTTAGTNYIGTSDAQNFQIKTNAQTRMTVSASGNVGVGSAVPGNSAILDMSSYINKALYLPQVPLVSPTDVSTIPAPQPGMIVYNTKTDYLNLYDGAKWNQAPAANILVATPQLVGMAQSVNDNTTWASGNNIFYDTKSYDPENAIVIGTSAANPFKYTVTQAGKYQVFVNFTTNGPLTLNAPWYLRVRKNGVDIAGIDATVAAGASACLVCLDDFAMGDVITIYKAGIGSGWPGGGLSKVSIYRFQ